MSTDHIAACCEDTRCGASLRLSVRRSDGPGELIEVPRPFALVGRSSRCDVRLRGPDVSYRHALIVAVGGGVLCVDLCSRTGTLWDRQPKPAGWLAPRRPAQIGSSLVGVAAGDEQDGHVPASDGGGGPGLPSFTDRPAEALPAVALSFNGSRRRRPPWPVNRVLTLVGRSSICWAQLVADSISKVHCGLLLTRDGLWIIDLLGRGGVEVNQAPVERCLRLAEGDSLKIGPFRAQVRYSGGLERPKRLFDAAPVPPVSTRDFVLNEVVAAGLLPPAEAARLRRVPPAAEDATPLIQSLTAAGVLTRWQAKRIADGKPLVLDGRYRLESRLGRGGMAKVYRATDLRLDRSVAVKIPLAALAASPVIQQRFMREARLNAKLSHPHTVRVLDIARDASFLVLEYVRGESLKARLARLGPHRPDVAVEFVAQIVSALDALCEHGIVHRDIKPSNILITSDGSAKLLDLGLAGTLPEATAADADPLTSVGAQLGTPHYMAPEQADSAHAADTRSDIYSIGCTLYHLLRGAPPFDSSNPVEVLLKHAREPVPPITGIDAALQRIVEKALAKRPDERYQTPRELQAALRRWQQVHPAAGASPQPEAPGAEWASRDTSFVIGDSEITPGTDAPSGQRSAEPVLETQLHAAVRPGGDPISIGENSPDPGVSGWSPRAGSR
ncbi:MAG TPA: FHA domain-containing serine/threonine-protein kinase [Planctomycetaceae bacterium]|nr:FHA domain-containing serine/threonine-protein kinase [Planctomycetaceae bacterium]